MKSTIITTNKQKYEKKSRGKRNGRHVMLSERDSAKILPSILSCYSYDTEELEVWENNHFGMTSKLVVILLLSGDGGQNFVRNQNEILRSIIIINHIKFETEKRTHTHVRMHFFYVPSTFKKFKIMALHYFLFSVALNTFGLLNIVPSIYSSSQVRLCFVFPCPVCLQYSQ